MMSKIYTRSGKAFIIREFPKNGHDIGCTVERTVEGKPTRVNIYYARDGYILDSVESWGTPVKGIPTLMDAVGKACDYLTVRGGEATRISEFIESLPGMEAE